MRPLQTFVLTLCTATTAQAQWVRQPTTTQASLRGLSVVDSNVVWASGSEGTYLWTSNGGTEWHSGTVPGATTFDLRGVHAVSLDTAYVMVAGADTARIYKTTDRGAHWTLQYDDTRKGVFLDGIAFFDPQHALVIGDPMGGHFLILKTDDGGAHWRQIPPLTIPAALPDEAEFAASNTALVTYGSRDAWVATGGGRAARVLRTHDGGETWTVHDTPVAAGQSGSGIFSLTFVDAAHGLAVGGNYAKPDTAAIAVAFTSDSGTTWTPATPSGATGYLSGVASLPASQGKRVIAVGTQGTAYSLDGGQHWTRLDTHSLNVVAIDQKTGRVWGAGEDGVIVVLNSSQLGSGPKP
jgi:photosystem II stability/assembly factor-like uncharacterized protein